MWGFARDEAEGMLHQGGRVVRRVLQSPVGYRFLGVTRADVARTAAKALHLSRSWAKCRMTFSRGRAAHPRATAVDQPPENPHRSTSLRPLPNLSVTSPTRRPRIAAVGGYVFWSQNVQPIITTSNCRERHRVSVSGHYVRDSASPWIRVGAGTADLAPAGGPAAQAGQDWLRSLLVQGFSRRTLASHRWAGRRRRPCALSRQPSQRRRSPVGWSAGARRTTGPRPGTVPRSWRRRQRRRARPPAPNPCPSPPGDRLNPVTDRPR